MTTNATNWQDLERRAVQLLRAVAPELAMPIYLVESSKIIGNRFPFGCTACTSTMMSLAIRPNVENWHGPGMAIIYSRGQIEIEAASRSCIAWKYGEDPDGPAATSTGKSRA